MAKKRNKISYAEAARKIIQRYKRRLGKDLDQFDSMSVDAMRRELEALMQQQEETRAKMLEADQVKMCHGGRLRRYGQGGGLPQMQGGGPFASPYFPQQANPFLTTDWGVDPNTQFDPQFWSYGGYAPGQPPQQPPQMQTVAPTAQMQPVNTARANVPVTTLAEKSTQQVAPQNTVTPFNPRFWPQPVTPEYTPGYRQGEVVQTSQSRTTTQQPDKRNSWWSNIPSEAKIGALAQGLGVVGSGIAALANRPEDLKYTSVATPKYTPVSDEEAIRQAQLAYQDAARASRGLSPSRYYSQMGQLASGRTGATAGIAERIANINAQGMNQNAWQAAQLGLQNQRMKMITDQYNQQRQDEYGNIIPQTIAGLAGTVAGGARDALAYRIQKETLPYLGQANFQVHSEKDGTVLSTHIGGGFSHYLNKDGEMEYFEGRIKLKDKDEFDKKYQKYLKSKSSMSGALPGKKK